MVGGRFAVWGVVDLGLNLDRLGLMNVSATHVQDRSDLGVEYCILERGFWRRFCCG